MSFISDEKERKSNQLQLSSLNESQESTDQPVAPVKLTIFPEPIRTVRGSLLKVRLRRRNRLRILLVQRALILHQGCRDIPQFQQHQDCQI